MGRKLWLRGSTQFRCPVARCSLRGRTILLPDRVTAVSRKVYWGPGPCWTLHAQKGTSDSVVIPASTVRVRCLHSSILLFFLIALALKLWEDNTI